MSERFGLKTTSLQELPNEVLVDLIITVLEKGKAFRFQAKGSSMTPFIKDGDVITLERIQGGKIRRGDVVAVISPTPGNLRVHRVVKISKGSYIIKGDNAGGIDGTFDIAQILGRVIKVERGTRTIQLGSRAERALIGLLSGRNLLPRALAGLWPIVRRISQRWEA